MEIKTANEWKEFVKSGKKPVDVPSHLELIYQNEWEGFGVFFGTGNKLRKDFLSYNKAKELIQSIGIKSESEWRKYYRSGKKPDYLPINLPQAYKSYWKGYGDFFGTGRKADQNKVFVSFETAKNHVSKLKLKNVKEWNQYCKSGKKPENIPAGANNKYKNKGWVSWSDFLGTKNISPQNRNYKSFEEAKKFVQTLNLTSISKWVNYYRSNLLPRDIPKTPNNYYKNKGWKGWSDFLGKE